MALTDFPRLPRPGQYQTRAQRLNRLDMLTSAEVRRLQARFRQEATQQAQGLGRADALRFAPPRGTPSVTPTPPFGARPLPLPPEFVSPEQAARIRAAPGITSGLLEPVGRFSKRFLEPTQALGGQALEATLKTPGLFLGQGIREVEQRLGGRQAPPPPELPSIVRRGPVNPVTAAFGNDEEIARAQTVLQEDLSLPESMAAQIIFDPLNLVPGIGFTKTKQFGQLLRTATQATGPARIRALTALRESEVLKGAAKAVRSEVGGVAPELVARRAELLTENRALKTLVQEGRATPQQEARLTQVRNEIADLGTEGGGRAPRPVEPLPSEGGAVPPGRPPSGPALPPEPPVPPAEAVPVPGNRFVGELRPFDDVVNDVVTSDNAVIRAVAGHTGINPSVLQNTPTGKALTAYYRQRVAVQELTDTAVAASLDVHAQRFTGRRGGVFSIADDGTVKNVPGGKIWNDVFSRPGDYPLTSSQKAMVGDYLQVVDEVERLRVASGLRPRAKVGPEGWFYVPRQVKGVRGIEIRRPSSPALQRHYELAQEGAARGIKYDADPRATLQLHVRAAYEEIIHKQLSDALEPLSIAPKELVPEAVRVRMEKAVAERLAAERARRALTVSRPVEKVAPKGLRSKLAGERAAADARLTTARAEYNQAKNIYSRAIESARKKEVAPGALFGKAEENIAIAQWRNRFFLREDADKLTEALGSFGHQARHENLFARGFELLGNHVRFLSAVGDFAAPFIQGLPVLARNPVVWGRASAAHYFAWFDPTVQARYIRDHIETFQEMSRHGVPIGDPEFFAAIREGGGVSAGQLLKNLPKGDVARGVAQQAGRQTFGRFQSSYNMFLSMSRAQLWDSMKVGWRGSLDDLAAHVRNMTGGLDSRALGVGPNQRGFESTWLAFSPRLLRSTAALVSDLRLGLGNARGRAAWRALSSLVAGTTALYVGSGIAMGKSREEIMTGLNPTKGKRFLSHNVNGDWIGVGGQVRAIAQLLAGTASAAAPGGRPAEDLLTVADNPLIQFYQARGAPGLNIGGGALEFLTGANVLQFENIDSPPDLFKHIGTSALPFAIQGILEGEQPLTTGAGLAGARTSAGTPYEALKEMQDTIAREKGAASYAEADSPLQAEIDADPRMEPIQAELDRRQAQRAPTRESEFFQETEATRTEQQTAQEADDANLNSGQWSGDVWRDKFSDRQRDFFNQREGIKRAFKMEFEDQKPSNKVDSAINDYFDVNVDDYVQPDGTTDWKGFFGAQEDALKPLSGADKTRVMNFIHKYDTPTVTQFRKAQDVVDRFYETPKYKGLSVEEGEEVDEVLNKTVPNVQLQAMRAGREVDRREAIKFVLRQGGISQDAASWLRRSFKPRNALVDKLIRRRLHENGVPQDVIDRIVGGVKLEELYNPERDDFLLENQELLARFYPDLLQKQLSREQEAGLGQPAYAAVSR